MADAADAPGATSGDAAADAAFAADPALAAKPSRPSAAPSRCLRAAAASAAGIGLHRHAGALGHITGLPKITITNQAIAGKDKIKIFSALCRRRSAFQVRGAPASVRTTVPTVNRGRRHP